MMKNSSGQDLVEAMPEAVFKILRCGHCRKTLTVVDTRRINYDGAYSRCKECGSGRMTNIVGRISLMETIQVWFKTNKQLVLVNPDSILEKIVGRLLKHV
jgi:DNA-directed RNA polymerase subunit RPC12/RpoP